MPTISLLSLTPRDIDIFIFVHSYGSCTIEHLRRRFFPTPGARSACYARILRLTEARYLSSTRLPSLTGIGSGKSLLTIGPQARPVLAEALGIPRSEIERVTRSMSPFVIAHHLATCDVRLAVELATVNLDQVTLTEWLTDEELHRNPMKVKDPLTQKELPIVPDGAFTLELSDGSSQQFFVEVDRSTVPAGRFKAKLYAYLVDAQQRAERVPFLIVATTKERQGYIARWANEEASALKADPTIFFLTTLDAVTEQTVLAQPIWQVVGGPSQLAVLPPEITHAASDPVPEGDHHGARTTLPIQRHEGTLGFQT